MQLFRLEHYNVCINHDPVVILTDFTAMSTLVTYKENCSNAIEGNKSGNGQMDRILMNLKKEFILTLSLGYIHVYYYYTQTSLLVYISDLRLVFTKAFVIWLQITIGKHVHVMYTPLHPIFI